MNRFDTDYFPQHDDASRRGYVHCSSNWQCVTGRVTVSGATICHGFFGSGDKNQSTTNTQVGASEEAEQIYASGSNVSKAGAIALTGSNIRDLTLTDGGAYDLARDFIASYNSTLSDLVSKQTDASSDSQSKTADLLNSLITGFGSIVESKNTDGESNRNQTILYIALAIAAVFGLFIWKRSR